MKTSKPLTTILSILLTVVLLLSVLSVAVMGIGLDPIRMADMFRRHGQAMFVQTDGRRLEIAQEIVDYLKFARDDLPAFQPHEQLHMADVRGIFRILYMLAVPGLPALAALWGLRRKGSLRICGMTCIALLTCIGAVLVWCAVDFDSLFLLFHRVAFTNDLWLLDPRTDLMIQLMPTPFFLEYAILIAGIFLGAAAVLAALSLVLNRRYHP
ncbi:MAG: TIGR01906 family membrane protein [Clostridia bacterium]|nr:TIGR01906 family membrane protein [Clostridia bacterium]